MHKNDYLLISTCFSFICAYSPLIMSRSHIKVEVKSGQDQIGVIFKERYSYVVGLHLNQVHSCSKKVFGGHMCIILEPLVPQF